LLVVCWLAAPTYFNGEQYIRGDVQHVALHY